MFAVCIDSAAAHDGLDVRFELYVHTGGGPDQKIIDIEGQSQRSTMFDVKRVSAEGVYRKLRPLRDGECT